MWIGAAFLSAPGLLCVCDADYHLGPRGHSLCVVMLSVSLSCATPELGTGEGTVHQPGPPTVNTRDGGKENVYAIDRCTGNPQGPDRCSWLFIFS